MSECFNCGDEHWESKAVQDPETGYAVEVCNECYRADNGLIPWSQRRRRA
jgi:hypothetical protein